MYCDPAGAHPPPPPGPDLSRDDVAACCLCPFVRPSLLTEVPDSAQRLVVVGSDAEQPDCVRDAASDLKRSAVTYLTC